ncbi:MAG: MarR family transcriptional regulator [Gammaproteobacteria bacterium]
MAHTARRGESSAEGGWTFLSNHTHVLVCLAGNGSQRLRDVAVRVGITERAVQRIVADLEHAGVLVRERDPLDGRRNRYRFDRAVPLRHPLEAHCRIGDLLRLVTPRAELPQAHAGSRPRTATVRRRSRR